MCRSLMLYFCSFWDVKLKKEGILIDFRIFNYFSRRAFTCIKRQCTTEIADSRKTDEIGNLRKKTRRTDGKKDRRTRSLSKKVLTETMMAMVKLSVKTRIFKGND